MLRIAGLKSGRTVGRDEVPTRHTTKDFSPWRMLLLFRAESPSYHNSDDFKVRVFVRESDS